MVPPTGNSAESIRSSGGFNIQRRLASVISGNQQGHTERPRHDPLLPVHTLTEPEGEVTDDLGTRLDRQVLVIVKLVAHRLGPGVLDHRPGVGLQAGHGASEVVVDLDNLLHRRRFPERRVDPLLDTENDALACSDLRTRTALDF